MRVIQTLRRDIVRQIKRKATPHFHDLGFRKLLKPRLGFLSPTRRLRGFNLAKPILLKFAGADNQVTAITEEGVVIETRAGDCIRVVYAAIAVEDLGRINRAMWTSVA